jgi:hypothetical protein
VLRPLRAQFERRRKSESGCGFHDVLQRAVKIGGHIECSMICSLERPGEIDQLTGPVNVNSSIQVENAKHHTISTQLFRHEHITLHHAEFVGGIAKIASMRPNHYMQTNRDFLASRRDQACTGRYSAFQETAAQFDALRPAALGCDRGVQRVDTYFDNEIVVHRVGSVALNQAILPAGYTIPLLSSSRG